MRSGPELKVSLDRRGHPPGTSGAAATSKRATASKACGIDPVLLLQHARRQRLGVVARQDRHPRLGDDRSGVEFGGYEVNRASMLGEPLGERPLHGCRARAGSAAARGEC